MPGRPLLQIPGPTLVPDRIVRAMAQPIIDHRGPRFAMLVQECLARLKDIFQTQRGHVVLYPGSGTGAWEAAIVNTLSPGDRVLACVNGHFATGFARTATAYGVESERLELPYGAGVPAAEVEERLRRDTTHEIRAVLMAQRNLDRRDLERPRRARGPRSRRPSGPAPRRHRLVAGVDRLPAR